jgi:hypothetical protein
MMNTYMAPGILGTTPMMPKSKAELDVIKEKQFNEGYVQFLK